MLALPATDAIRCQGGKIIFVAPTLMTSITAPPQTAHQTSLDDFSERGKTLRKIEWFNLQLELIMIFND